MRRRGLLTAVRIIVVGLPLPLRARQLPRIRFRITRRSLGYISCVFVAAAMLVICLGALPAAAQKQGGTLRVYMSANPSSLSILEEVSFTTVMAAAPIFNGLVVFDPMKPIAGIDTVVPDLAVTWSWDVSGTKFTFKLRQGVKWHDGKPFTAKDVQCTWYWLTGKNGGYFRKDLAARDLHGRGPLGDEYVASVQFRCFKLTPFRPQWLQRAELRLHSTLANDEWDECNRRAFQSTPACHPARPFAN